MVLPHQFAEMTTGFCSVVSLYDDFDLNIAERLKEVIVCRHHVMGSVMRTNCIMTVGPVMSIVVFPYTTTHTHTHTHIQTHTHTHTVFVLDTLPHARALSFLYQHPGAT